MHIVETLSKKDQPKQLYVYRASKGTEAQQSKNGTRIKRVWFEPGVGWQSQTIQNHPQRKFTIMGARERLIAHEGYSAK